jgi:hypothetical protein
MLFYPPNPDTLIQAGLQRAYFFEIEKSPDAVSRCINLPCINQLLNRGTTDNFVAIGVISMLFVLVIF